MDRLLVVVFSNRDEAVRGSRVLRELHDKDYIEVYDSAIIAKSPKGTITVKRSTKYGPVGTLRGLAVGGLIGLLGGPVGAVLGATGGTLIGALADLENVRVGTDFVQRAASELAPGKAALVAEIEEDETTLLDARMQELGGHVLRRSLRELKRVQNEQDVATLKAEIARMKVDHANARAERKAKLKTRIDTLNARLKKKTDQARTGREVLRRDAEVKIEALKRKALGQSKSQMM